MKQKEIVVHYFETGGIEELTPVEASLTMKAREAAKDAWAPYSGFRVGAALLLESGEVVTGNNQENAAYPSGLCAERVALFAANARFPSVPVVAMAVSASNQNGLVSEPVKPCGACLQSILESELRFRKPIRLILDGKDHILLIDGVKNLLPFSFGRESLI